MNPDPIGLTFSLQQASKTAEVEELTCLADHLGFDSVWIPEAWGRDAFTLLAALAMDTRSIRLATGIVNVFSRTPAIVAQSIASLDELSGGRAILGLGASGPRVVEQWHGLKFENVLQRTREFVDVVRLILSGDRVSYDGQIYKLNGFSLAFQPPRSDIPIFLAAIGPANTRLTGEIADGWLPIFASRKLLAAGDEYLTEGATAANRSRNQITVAAYIPALLGSRGPELVRRHIAFYVGAMGSFYYRQMVRGGWEREAAAIRERWQAGDSSAARELVGDEIVGALAITGNPEDGRRRLAEFRRQGIDLPVLAVPEGADVAEIRATLEALGG
jgi:F420-dependent oxidoreductase-like protein